jgi:hypothetical protein
MTKKFNYYHVDAGHFKVQIKLCFDNYEFQKILSDHNISTKTTALDYGIGETHYISDGREGIIVLAFDLEECDQGPAYLAGVVAHEATHCVSRVFEHIGEEVDEIGEESRAYLTEHIVTQLTQAVIYEKEKRARKGLGGKAKQKNKAAGGTELQVDQHDLGGAGSDSDTEQQGAVRGTKDDDRKIVSTSGVGLQRTRGARIPRGNHKKHIRRGEIN